MDRSTPGQPHKNILVDDMPIKSVDLQVSSIIRTVLERCKSEKNRQCLQVPLEDYYERVSFYTGLPKMYIHSVTDENLYNNDVRVFDGDDHIILMNCINNFITMKLNPNIKDLYVEFLKNKNKIKPDAKLSLDLQTFEKKINCSGYSYKKNSRGLPSFLMEDPKIKFERFNFLLKLRDYRDKRNLKIYFVDESLISQRPFRNPFNQHQVNLCKQDVIFFHLISYDDYENGIFVSKENEENLEETFKKWMVDIVLYSVKPGSVLVLSNNTLHGPTQRKSMTRYHSRKEMLQWLRQNNVPCDPDMKKPILYELIEKCTINNKENDIERVFKANGCHVLRLPENFHSLSPTKYMWEFLNENFKCIDKNSENSRTFLLSFILHMDKLMWTYFKHSSIAFETQIFQLDVTTEDLIENNFELDAKSIHESM